MRAFVFALLATVALARVYTAVDQIWTNCGKATDHFHMQSISINPDPPKIGQNVSISVKGTLDETLTSGQAQLTVKYFGVKLLDLKQDICEFDPKTYPCPIAAGPWGIEQSVEIPAVTPKGHYTGNVMMKDQKGEEIACYNFDFNMSK